MKIPKISLEKQADFSLILQHRETLEYRYFYVGNNEQLLKSL